MNADRASRIAVARARATALEEKARTNPERAKKLAEMARKLRVGAAILERNGAPTQGDQVAPGR